MACYVLKSIEEEKKKIKKKKRLTKPPHSFTHPHVSILFDLPLNAKPFTVHLHFIITFYFLWLCTRYSLVPHNTWATYHYKFLILTFTLISA